MVFNAINRLRCKFLEDELRTRMALRREKVLEGEAGKNVYLHLCGVGTRDAPEKYVESSGFVSVKIRAVLRLTPLGPQVGALLHVCKIMSAYLDMSSKWKLWRAIECEYWDLVDLVISSMKRDGASDRREKQRRASFGMSAAAKKGAIDIMQRLVDSFGVCFDGATVLSAAESDQLEAALWLLVRLQPLKFEHRPQLFSSAAGATAAKTGSLEFVLMLLKESTSGERKMFLPSLVQDALKLGHTDILKAVLEQFSSDAGTEVLDNAACNGDLEAVQLLTSYGAYASVAAMDHAAANGHLDVVRWLHENRSEGGTIGDTDPSSDIISQNHYRFLMLSERSHFNLNAAFCIDKAASRGHLEIVKFLHTHRNESCSMSGLGLAVMRNHLDVVKWIYANTPGIRCSFKALKLAAAKGNLEVVQWVVENRPGIEHLLPSAMKEAASEGQLAVIKFLHEKGVQSSCAMDKAAEKGHLSVVQWLHEHGHEGCSLPVIDSLATRNQHEVLEYLRVHRPSDFTPWLVRDNVWI